MEFLSNVEAKILDVFFAEFRTKLSGRYPMIFIVDLPEVMSNN